MKQLTREESNMTTPLLVGDMGKFLAETMPNLKSLIMTIDMICGEDHGISLHGSAEMFGIEYCGTIDVHGNKDELLQKYRMHEGKLFTVEVISIAPSRTGNSDESYRPIIGTVKSVSDDGTSPDGEIANDSVVF